MDWLNDSIQALLDPLGWTGVAAIKLCLAALLGGIIGSERERRGREAGLRTNLLVCVGSALVMLVSTRLADMPWGSGGTGAYNINVDPGRIAYGVMTGIGFLGAGAILKSGNTVHGLTTAAGIWCVAAVGLAAGLGLYVLAGVAALLVLSALSILNGLEKWLLQRCHRKLTIRTDWQPASVAKLLERCAAARIKVFEHSFRRSDDLSRVDIELCISCVDGSCYNAFEAQIQGDEKYKLMASERL